jgi:hypothetical protein
MKQIQRQENELDRAASTHLASGKISQAVDHYLEKNQLQLIESEQVVLTLLNTWESSLDQGLSNQIILAYTRKQVAELNFSAREILLKKGQVSGQSISIQTTFGKLDFAPGDRIVFLKNNRELGVCNGDFATIQSIEGSTIQVQLKDRSLSFDSSKYPDFNYGYAVTVHKSQGATFDRVFVALDGFGWDRFLTYVAFTRHRKELNVFANKTHYQNLDQLKKQLSQAKVRDNAIDYPLSFSERRGFDPESILGKALDFLELAKHSMEAGWKALRHMEYEARHKRNKNGRGNLEMLIRSTAWEMLENQGGSLFQKSVDLLLKTRSRYLDEKTSPVQRKIFLKSFIEITDRLFENKANQFIFQSLPKAFIQEITSSLRQRRNGLERERME